MRKATLLALLMIANVLVANAFVSIIAGAILLAAGSTAFGLWLGHHFWAKPADQKIKQLEQELTNSTLDNLATLESAALNVWDRSKVITYDLGDAVHYGRNYAWALAKYTILKSLEQGNTLDAAASKARAAVLKYYLNVTKNIIEEMNNTAEYLNFTLNRYAEESQGVNAVDKAGISFRVKIQWLYFSGSCQIGENKTLTYSGNGNTYHLALTWNKPYLKLQKVNVKVLGKKYTVLTLAMNIGQNLHFIDLKFRDPSGHDTVVYNWNVYANVLNQINNEYNNIVNNINAYVQGLKNSTFNTTDLIDPYVLATFLDKDYNKTGYYGYAAAELALLGLNTTGLNKTVTISYQGKNLSGFLFTDWTGTLQVNQTYQPDNNHVWYFVTTDSNGRTLLVPLSGQFKVVSLEDWQGHKLNNTTLVNYDPHSGDVQKIYQELEKIETLYEQYLNNLQPAAGGGGFSAELSNWWNSLDETAKLGVIAVGCVAVYAIFRRR